jgi:hypothetical protein
LPFAYRELIAWCDLEQLSYPGVAPSRLSPTKDMLATHYLMSQGLQKRIHVQFSVDAVIEE